MDLECNEEKYSTILVSGSQSQTIYKGRPILEQAFKLQDAQAQRLTSLGNPYKKWPKKGVFWAKNAVFGEIIPFSATDFPLRGGGEYPPLKIGPKKVFFGQKTPFLAKKNSVFGNGLSVKWDGSTPFPINFLGKSRL